MRSQPTGPTGAGREAGDAAGYQHGPAAGEQVGGDAGLRAGLPTSPFAAEDPEQRHIAEHLILADSQRDWVRMLRAQASGTDAPTPRFANA